MTTQMTKTTNTELLSGQGTVPEAVEGLVDKIFYQLFAACPQMRSQFDEQQLPVAKRMWILAFYENGINRIEQVRLGMRKVRSNPKGFFPSVGEFISWCKSESAAEYHALGLPSEEEAMKRFKSYMGFHKHDEANFNYRSKAEYWFCKEAYKRCGMRDEKHLAAELPKVLREAADKVRAGFDFPAIPKFVQHIPVIDPKKFDAGIAKCKAVLRGVAQ